MKCFFALLTLFLLTTQSFAGAEIVTSKIQYQVLGNLKNSLSAADFNPYMQELQRIIKRNWQPTRDTESYTVIVFFKITKEGELFDLSIKESGGTRIRNKQAIRAVKRSAPFPKLPEGSPDFVSIEFSFDYNLIKY